MANTEFKGTGGNWKAVEGDSDNWNVVTDENDFGFGTIYVAQDICQGKDYGEADAHLVAAAPDLLKSLIAWLEINGIDPFIIAEGESKLSKQAKAAIAKALGNV